MTLDRKLAAPADEHPSALSILINLVECTELNMDDVEPHTRAVSESARIILQR